MCTLVRAESESASQKIWSPSTRGWTQTCSKACSQHCTKPGMHATPGCDALHPGGSTCLQYMNARPPYLRHTTLHLVFFCVQCSSHGLQLLGIEQQLLVLYLRIWHLSGKQAISGHFLSRSLVHAAQCKQGATIWNPLTIFESSTGTSACAAEDALIRHGRPATRCHTQRPCLCCYKGSIRSSNCKGIPCVPWAALKVFLLAADFQQKVFAGRTACVA